LALVLISLTQVPKQETPQEFDSVTETPAASTAAPETPAPTIEPTPEVTLEPELVSLGTFRLSAYCPCVKCCEIWSAEHPSRVGTDYVQKTKSGTIPTAGRTIGVDPEVIPLGTTVLINGIEYVAEDIGGGVNGNHIDIFFDTHEEACAFGIQEAEVIIKSKEVLP